MAFEEEEEKKEIWWRIYNASFLEKLTNKNLIALVKATEFDASRLKIQVGFDYDNVRIKEGEPTNLTNMRYKVKCSGENILYHKEEHNAKRIMRILHSGDYLRKNFIFSEINYLEINSFQPDKKGVLSEVPEVSFPIKYKKHAQDYSSKINPKTTVRMQSGISENLEFNLLLNNQEIGFFSKKEKARAFNKISLNGKGTIRKK